MKRALVVLALLAFGALFAPAARAAVPGGRLASLRMHRLALTTPAAVGSTPASTYVIGGSVEDFNGQPLADWDVDWGWFDPDVDSWSNSATVYHYGASATTASDGTFSFPAVTSDPGHDDLFAYDENGNSVLEQWGLDFSTTSNYVLRPAHVAVSVAHAPVGQPIDVQLGDSASSYAVSQVSLTQGAGTAEAAAPDFNSGVAFYYSPYDTVASETEWLNPNHLTVAVTPGALASTPVSFDFSQAVHAHLLGPLCQHAGRPGSLVRFAVSDVPAGEQISFSGQSLSPDAWGLQTYPAATLTSTGPDRTYTVALRVPRRATLGEVYQIDAARTDDPQSLLDLYDYYQVCAFGASRTTVARGGVVRLSGQADTMNSGFTVTLFMRHTRAGVPSTTKAKGWTKVATLGLNSHGKFHSALLRPRRTTWYVARFYESDAGFTAFTPVVRVAVQ